MGSGVRRCETPVFPLVLLRVLFLELFTLVRNDAIARPQLVGVHERDEHAVDDLRGGRTAT